MNPELKSRWVEALRSGRYPQGREALQTNGSFCCLGVICELVAEETGLIIWPDPVADGVVMYGEQKETGLIPEEIQEFVGIPTLVQDQLVEMNDGDRIGFDEIADWIEENL